MSAIITSNFRTLNANNLLGDVADTATSLYIAIGKSDAWSSSLSVTLDGAAPTPADSLVEVNDLWQNLIALKRITSSDVINICPRHDWVSGNVYVAWDDTDSDIFAKQFYCITDEFKVFKCLRAGTGASTYKPSNASSTSPFSFADGYTWKYMFTLAVTDASKFLTADYIPVKTVPYAPTFATPDLETKYDYQQACITNTNGKIYRYVVENGGTGYTSAPSVTVHGDGTGAAAIATVSGGAITSVTVNTGGSGFDVNAGSNYNVAYLTISGPGTGAIVRAVLSPYNGHGSDPVSELGGFYVGIAAQFQYADGSGDFIVDNTFRQIALIRNPYNYGTTTIATATTRSALKALTYTPGGTPPAVGDYITGGTSGTIAFVDAIDVNAGTIKYHQNDKTGYGSFANGESITGHLGGSGTVISSVTPEVQAFSGSVVFVDNRDPIVRSASQIEDVKMIIEF